VTITTPLVIMSRYVYTLAYITTTLYLLRILFIQGSGGLSPVHPKRTPRARYSAKEPRHGAPAYLVTKPQDLRSEDRESSGKEYESGSSAESESSGRAPSTPGASITGSPRPDEEDDPDSPVPTSPIIISKLAGTNAVDIPPGGALVDTNLQKPILEASKKVNKDGVLPISPLVLFPDAVLGSGAIGGEKEIAEPVEISSDKPGDIGTGDDVNIGSQASQTQLPDAFSFDADAVLEDDGTKPKPFTPATTRSKSAVGVEVEKEKDPDEVASESITASQEQAESPGGGGD
jgi:hypothetical protein